MNASRWVGADDHDRVSTRSVDVYTIDLLIEPWHNVVPTLRFRCSEGRQVRELLLPRARDKLSRVPKHGAQRSPDFPELRLLSR